MSYKVSIDSLKKCDYNPRKISKKRLQRLSASVQNHTKALSGWDPTNGVRLASTVTINKNGNRIIGGHQRIEALLNLGQDWIHEDDITWVELKESSPEEKSLNLSLNNDEAAGRWEKDKLTEILSELKDSSSALFDSLDFSSLSASLKEANSSTEAEDSLKKAKEQELFVKDNLSFVVQEILSKHGETVPQGFLFFAYKNRLHLLVQCDDNTYNLTKMVAETLKRDNTAINEFLSVLFRVGLDKDAYEEVVGKVLKNVYEPVSPDEIEDSEQEGEK
jgi:hypothetical protein